MQTQKLRLPIILDLDLCRFLVKNPPNLIFSLQKKSQLPKFVEQRDFLNITTACVTTAKHSDGRDYEHDVVTNKFCILSLNLVKSLSQMFMTYLSNIIAHKCVQEAIHKPPYLIFFKEKTTVDRVDSFYTNKNDRLKVERTFVFSSFF